MKLKRRLYLKQLIGLGIFGILGFLTISVFTYQQNMKYIEHEASVALYREASLIASDYAQNYLNHNVTLEDVEEQLSALDTYLDTHIMIVDLSGNVLINSRRDDAIYPDKIQGFNTRDFGSRYYRIGNFYQLYPEEMMTVFHTITASYKVQGYVILNRPVSALTEYGNGFLSIAYVTFGILFVISLLMLIVFTITVYLPLRKMTQAAGEYAKGNFDRELNVYTNDEMSYLAASIQYMANELNTLESDQRKFISNVSHDFRSPLTSIKGYIEAILDGTIPTELQGKYLNIILFETERLNKLTKSLLELNKYGSKGSMLDITNFDINQTIKTTVQTFEGTCKTKRISFELVLTGQELFVSADMSKIQQVLYNLIDNAIKFSHNDSSIKIETSLKNDKVFVSVKDSGIGIPKDSINKVWERFYKTDLSRGKDKRGTGLGLAIVKDIITSHNEIINVVSTEGVGTEFIFTLPIQKVSRN